jgi:hypothetical protein
MYAVRSISPHRGAVTTHHESEYLAQEEIKNRIKNGHRNAMVTDPLCKHKEQHPASLKFGSDSYHCLCCDSCGMITHVAPASLPDAPYASPELEEVPA